MMTEFNPINLKQGAGFPGIPDKLRKGKTGGETEQITSFVCVMGNPCHTTTQKTGKISLNSRLDKGKMSEVRSQKSGIVGQGSEVRGQRSEIVDAPELLKFNLKNAVAEKGKGITENPHGVILKDINSSVNASKGKDGVRDQKSKMKENQGLLKFNLKNMAAVKGKSAVGDAITGRNTEKNFFAPVNDGGESNIGNSLKYLGLKSEAGKYEIRDWRSKVRDQRGWHVQARLSVKDEVLKKNMEAKVADPAGENLSNGKNHAVLFKNGKNIAGISNALFGGQRPEVRSQKTSMEDAPELLKFNLKNMAAVKGKSAIEPDKTEKNSFILTKNDGKNEIKDILRHSDLKSGEAIEILHRKISSASHLDKISSAGAYHHTAFHAESSSAAVNENAGSYSIEPRALIKQIANGVKKPGRVRIMLNPPRLGALDVDVLVRDNKVRLILQTENNDVRHILESNMESLKGSLRSHGLVTDAINVLVQEKSDGANYRSGQNGTLFGEGGNPGWNEETRNGEQNSLNHNSPSLEEENPRVRSDKHGGRVSLFA